MKDKRAPGGLHFEDPTRELALIQCGFEPTDGGWVARGEFLAMKFAVDEFLTAFDFRECQRSTEMSVPRPGILEQLLRVLFVVILSCEATAKRGGGG